MSKIYLYNTDGRKKQEFIPIKEGEVSMYSCGPTVYHFIHLGNVRAYMFVDTLKRMFLFNDFKVNHIINITDVGHLVSDADDGEDKMLKGAKREGKTVYEIAEYYTKAFLDDFHAIRNIDPDKFTKATEHIKEMIDIIKLLEKNGYTYVADGNVYLDTNKVKDYGRLFGLQDRFEQKARVKEDKAKHSQRDFVLWFTNSKFANQDMQWDSPWGRGYPGWHIECSAMATKYLGKHFDIHTGGIDHIQVHHTNEIAQSECALGHDKHNTKWVNFWMHNEFLLTNDDKMAKSADSFLRLQSIYDRGFTAEDYRYLLLQTHYRKSINFSWDTLTQAKQALDKIKERIKDLLAQDVDAKKHKFNTAQEKHVNAFRKAINDDLNTPVALAELWDVLQSTAINAQQKYSLVLLFDKVLALGLDEIKLDNIPAKVQNMVDEREAARKAKDWKKSDMLRDEIANLGFVVKDTPQGPEVRKK